MAGSHEEMAYDLALRSIGQQEAALDNLRARTGTLLSAASLSTAFLGALGLKDQALTGGAWIAVGLFVAMGVSSGFVLWPWGWIFGLDTYEVIEEYVDADDRPTLSLMQRDLAIHIETNLQSNSARLARLYSAFQAAVLFLFAEIVTWLVILARR